MMNITKILGGRSAKFMMEQQRSLAKVEGYIEEVMEGQKVVKVFNHEEESKLAFKNLNDTLYKHSEEANRNGNILMPDYREIENG